MVIVLVLVSLSHCYLQPPTVTPGTLVNRRRPWKYRFTMSPFILHQYYYSLTQSIISKTSGVYYFLVVQKPLLFLSKPAQRHFSYGKKPAKWSQSAYTLYSNCEYPGERMLLFFFLSLNDVFLNHLSRNMCLRTSALFPLALVYFRDNLMWDGQEEKAGKGWVKKAMHRRNTDRSQREARPNGDWRK